MSIEKCERCLGSPSCQPHVASACLPVPAFGNVAGDSVEVVTVGLNPALNEFVEAGLVIENRTMRLPVVQDYGIAERSALVAADVQDARSRKVEYFSDTNRGWHSYFERMEMLLSRIEPRWTYATGLAAHADLVACATSQRWGKLPGDCKNEMMQNCRDHFLSTLSTVREGTLLLLDGAPVMDGVKKSGAGIEECSVGQLINTRMDLGWVGKLRVGPKVFPFRGWSIPVGRLTPVWRLDLAFWVNLTLRPNHRWHAGRRNSVLPPQPLADSGR